MKSYIKYAIILAIACFCFIAIDNVNATIYTPTVSVLTVDYTNSSGGGGNNVSNFSTTAPNYPTIKSFHVIYSDVNNPFGDTNFTGDKCFSISFGTKAPTDYRTIKNYNRLGDWYMDDGNSFNLRYVDFYVSNGFYYYTFYVQTVNSVGFMSYDFNFNYKGSINPYFTNQNYTFDKTTPVSRFVSCESISDSMLNSELDELHSEIDKSFNEVNDRIDDMESSINSNIDDLKQKQEEAHETSKGIWASLKDGISSIGNWFSELASSIGNFFEELGKSIANGFLSLFESIKSLFVGEEVCEDVVVSEGYPNFFTGFHAGFYYYMNIDEIYTSKQNSWYLLEPDSEGYMPMKYDNNTAHILADSNPNIKPNTKYKVFLEVVGGTFSSQRNVTKFNKYKSQLQFNEDMLYFNNKSLSVFTFTSSDNPSDAPYLLSLSFPSGSNTSVKFRIYVTDNLDMTEETYQYYGPDAQPIYDTVCRNEGGLFGMLSDFFKSIGEFFARLFGFMEDDNVDSSATGGFFDDFDDGGDYGLSDIIIMPLNTIKNITNSTCTPLKFPLPFVNQEMELPCMTDIYSQFGPILAIYQTITFGMIAYWVCVNLYGMVRNFKNPDSDEIEVVDL